MDIITSVYLCLGIDEYRISNVEEIRHLIKDIQRGTQLSILWLGTLEVTAIVPIVIAYDAEHRTRTNLKIYCRKAVRPVL